MSTATMEVFYNSLVDSKSYLESVETLLKIIAIVVAGTWAAHIFYRKREVSPKLNLACRVSSHPMPGGKLLIRVAVDIHNHSSVLARVNNGVCWIQQMEPVPDLLKQKLEKGENPIEENNAEYHWPLLAECNLPASVRELEPNEKEQIVREFFIADVIKRILVYVWIKNKKKKAKGWECSTVYELNNSRIIMSGQQREETKTEAVQEIRPSVPSQRKTIDGQAELKPKPPPATPPEDNDNEQE